MDRKSVQEWKTRRTADIWRGSFPRVGCHANFTRLQTCKPESRFGLHSSNLRLRQREREGYYIRFPCSDASIKYSIQQVRIVAKEREREIALQDAFSCSAIPHAKAVFDETVYVSDSEVISLFLLYSYARTRINKILSTDYETSGFMDQRFINNSSEEDSTPSFYRTNLSRNKSRGWSFFFFCLLKKLHYCITCTNASVRLVISRKLYPYISNKVKFVESCPAHDCWNFRGNFSLFFLILLSKLNARKIIDSAPFMNS